MQLSNKTTLLIFSCGTAGYKSEVESHFAIHYQKERENRAYMEGLSQGIHPKANAAGVGLKTVLREIECKPSGHPSLEPVPRVFV